MFGIYELVQKLRTRFKGPYYYEEEDEPEEEPDDDIVFILEEYE